MTIATEACTTTVIADGVSRTFNYSFRIPSKAEADLYLRDANGTVTLLDPASWSITGTGPDGSGGTFTYPLAPVPVLAAGIELTLARDVPYTQTTQLTNQSSYSPRTVERGLDRLDMQIQQLANVAERSVRVSITDGPIDDLPSIIERKGKVVGFDSVTGDVTLFPVPPPASGSNPDGYANVKDYGAIGDGSTDDTAAFQAAAATGLSLWLPPGSYLLSDTVTFSFAGQGMVGIGGASVVVPNGTFTMFQINGMNANAVFRDFYINGSVNMIGGVAFAADNGSSIFFNRITGTDVAVFLEADNVNGVFVEECQFVNGSWQEERFILIEGSVASAQIAFRDLYITATGEGSFNATMLQIDGNVSNVLLSGVVMNGGRFGLVIDNSIGAPAAPSVINGRDVSVNTTQQEGIRINAGSAINLVSTEAEGSETKSGVFIGAACSGVLVQGSASNNRRYGVETETGAASVTVDLSAANDNGMGPYSIPNGVGSDLNFLARGGVNVDAPMIVPGFAILECNGFGAEVELTVLAGQVTAAVVTRQGRAYGAFFPSTTKPTLVVTGNGGSGGCVLNPTISNDGRITSVAVTAPGAGYTWAVCRVDAENVAQQMIAWSPLFVDESSTFVAGGAGSAKMGNGQGLGLEVYAAPGTTRWVQALGAASGPALITVIAPSDVNADIILYGKGTGAAILGLSGGKIAFFQGAGALKQTVTGSRGGNAALASLLTALAAYGIITDGTTP